MKIILSLFTLFLVQLTFAQLQLKVFLTNGSQEQGYYKAKGNTLINLTANSSHHIDNIKEITYYTEKDSIHYYVVDTKTYVTSKKSRKNIARRAYAGTKIELYYIHYNWSTMHTNGLQSSNSYNEAFVKRKDEDFVYNMGYIYGAGFKGIKKRVRAYFTDCPELVEQVKKNNIKKHNTLEIVRYYDVKCSR